jgi:uncharacterized protein DUF6496
MAATLRRKRARPTRTQRIVHRTMKAVMGEYMRGQLRSRSGARVRKPRQAIAIGLSEARRAGARIPETGPRRPGPGR